MKENELQEVKAVDTSIDYVMENTLPTGVIRIDNTGSYVVKEEVIENGLYTKVTTKGGKWTDEPMETCSEFSYYFSNVDGGYIGGESEFKFLTKKKKLILIQKAESKHNTCSIGYSIKENKWYGWSHRAIYGFTIGDEVHEDDLTSKTGFVEEYAIQHPEECRNLPVGFKAMNLNDAKRMAIAYAEAVS